MLTLYLRNEGRTVLIDIGSIHLRFTGSKSLIRFVKINKVYDGMIHVDTEFLYDGEKVIEEEYIDLEDLLEEYNYNTKEILASITEYKIVNKEEKNNMTKIELLDKSLLASDNIAFVPTKGSAGDDQLIAINLSKMSLKATIRLKDGQILSSNMNDKMLQRTKAAFDRNKEQLISELKEKMEYA